MSPKKAIAVDPPEVLELFEAIANHYPAAVGFDGVIVRCVAARYAGKNDFFSGIGAAKAGGRWNRVGIEAVYASLEIDTAHAEAFQAFAFRALPLSGMLPRVTAGAEVSLTKVFDLTHLRVRKALGFTLQDLTDEDWRSLQKAGVESWTQAIGRGCHRTGFEGLIVPSARRRRGKNIVLFPDKVAKTGKIKILGEDQLPK